MSKYTITVIKIFKVNFVVEIKKSNKSETSSSSGTSKFVVLYANKQLCNSINLDPLLPLHILRVDESSHVSYTVRMNTILIAHSNNVYSNNNLKIENE